MGRRYIARLYSVNEFVGLMPDLAHRGAVAFFSRSAVFERQDKKDFLQHLMPPAAEEWPNGVRHNGLNGVNGVNGVTGVNGVNGVVAGEAAEKEPGCPAQYITFCSSGDAIILLPTPQQAVDFVAQSPVYKDGTEVELLQWSESTKVRLQFRGAYNRVEEEGEGPSS